MWGGSAGGYYRWWLEQLTATYPEWWDLLFK